MANPLYLSPADIDARLDALFDQDGTLKLQASAGNNLLLAASYGDGTNLLVVDRVVGYPTVSRSSATVLVVSAGTITFDGAGQSGTTKRAPAAQNVTNPGPVGTYGIWAVASGATWVLNVTTGTPAGADKLKLATVDWDGAAWVDNLADHIEHGLGLGSRLARGLVVTDSGGTRYERVSRLQLEATLAVVSFANGVMTLATSAAAVAAHAATHEFGGSDPIVNSVIFLDPMPGAYAATQAPNGGLGVLAHSEVTQLEMAFLLPGEYSGGVCAATLTYKVVGGQADANVTTKWRTSSAASNGVSPNLNPDPIAAPTVAAVSGKTYATGITFTPVAGARLVWFGINRDHAADTYLGNIEVQGLQLRVPINRI